MPVVNQEQRVLQRGVRASQTSVQSTDLFDAMAQQADVIGVGAVTVSVLQQPHASGVQ